MARQLIDYGKVAFVQIDCGRIGGIGPAKEVADYAVARGVTYVNHTFTSHLALAASLQPFAGLEDHVICEYPFAPKSVAYDITANHLMLNASGHVDVPDAPGLGMTIDEAGSSATSSTSRSRSAARSSTARQRSERGGRSNPEASA